MDVLATSWYRKAGGLFLIFTGRDPEPQVTSFPTLGQSNQSAHQQRTTDFTCYTSCEQTLVWPRNAGQLKRYITCAYNYLKILHEMAHSAVIEAHFPMVATTILTRLLSEKGHLVYRIRGANPGANPEADPEADREANAETGRHPALVHCRRHPPRVRHPPSSCASTSECLSPPVNLPPRPSPCSRCK